MGQERAMYGKRRLEIWRKLVEKNMIIRCVGMNSDGIWGRSLEMKRKGGGRENARKIYKVGTRSRIWNIGILDEEGVTEE